MFFLINLGTMKFLLFLITTLSIAGAFAPNPTIQTRRQLTFARADIIRSMSEQDTLEKANVESLKKEGGEEIKTEDLGITEECVVEEELSESQKLLKKVKESGTAGFISYAAWELAFWAISVPVCIVGYKSVTGHWPDLSNNEDLAQLGAEAFAFVNFARFAVPLRIGLALSTTPWVQENVVDRFMKKDEPDC